MLNRDKKEFIELLEKWKNLRVLWKMHPTLIYILFN